MIVRPREIPRFDTDNGIELRNYLESLRGTLATERSSWDQQYDQLSRFFQPRSTRFNYGDTDDGLRKDFDIINETATLCLRTLRAGMLSGMSSPTRVWFTSQMEQEDLNDLPEVKAYNEECDDRLRACFLKSNFYQTLHNSYGEEGLFGTTAFLMQEDAETDIRCHPWPVGSYYVSGADDLRINMVQRIYQMTVRQIVSAFGEANCSTQVCEWFHSASGGLKEQWLPIVHTIYPNSYFDGKISDTEKKWTSIHYELGNYKTGGKDPGILCRRGFYEMPVIVGRWDVVGENFYGESPAMDCLGTNMGMQRAELRTMQAIDKMVDPPMVGSPSLMNQKASILPGDVTFVEGKDGNGFKPAFQIQYELQYAMANIDRMERRIKSGLFTDLFLMLASSDRREITAEEIRAKQEEKMQVLGPVLERNNGEVLAPSVMRARAILERRGKLPKKPQILNGKKFKMKFVSILAQAQRLMGVANIERWVSTLGNMAGVHPDVLDVIDDDATARELGDDLSIPARCMRTKEAVKAMRAARQKQQAVAQAAVNAKNLAPAANVLANADQNNESLLTGLVPSLGAGGA